MTSPVTPESDQNTPPREPNRSFTPARRSATAWVVLLGVLLAGLGFDLGTKIWSFDNVADVPVVLDRTSIIENANVNPIPPHDSIVLIPGRMLNLHLVLNSGAVFGIGAEQRTFFVIFTILAVTICLLTFVCWMAADSTLAHIGIALVLAGALGNLWDRVLYGRVRDFLHMLPDRHLPFGWSWPGGNTELFPWVFNVADVMLLAGMALLLLHLHLSDRKQVRKTASSSQENGT
ncbi:MAG: signal peptidase II [Phycisphaerales bacterium]|nr:signal peptidase II [Phycisphaerales bacterium]